MDVTNALRDWARQVYIIRTTLGLLFIFLISETVTADDQC